MPGAARGVSGEPQQLEEDGDRDHGGDPRAGQHQAPHQAALL